MVGISTFAFAFLILMASSGQTPMSIMGDAQDLVADLGLGKRVFLTFFPIFSMSRQNNGSVLSV